MDFILIEHHRNVSDNDLITDVLATAKSLNQQTITQEQYKKHGKYDPSTLYRRFGSWFKVLEICGLNPSRPKIGISNEELFENIEKIWRHFGRQPKYHEIAKPLSKYSVGTYEYRFGSYYNALRSFINDINGCIIDQKNANSPKENKNPRSINYRTRFIVMQRDGFKCKICGASPSTDSGVTLHIDHIVPCAKGGTADIDNLQTLCSKCNLGKSDLEM